MSSERTHPHYDLIVLGGGASGLMCALTAGQRGKSVLVLDSSNKVGKKILMSGGGRCNFTNYYVDANNYLCSNPHFVKSALARYTNWDFIGLVEKHAIPYHERLHGELFCDNSAKDILAMLLAECDAARVQIKTKCEVNFVEPNDHLQQRFTLRSNLGVFTCESLVIATGGLSIPTMGATGFGYELATQFGLKVKPRRAGLVPFTFSGPIKSLTEKLSGLAIDVEMRAGETSFRENMLFTHRGISGPVALQVSNYWQEGDTISINLLPSIDIEEHLLSAKASKPKTLLRTLLSDHFSKAFCQELQTLFWPTEAEQILAEYSDAKLREIADKLSNWTLKPSGTEGYRTAEVTLGGVDTDAISSKTMECKSQPGLYFIGEVLDVTGWLGGFNFQWAWSSGVAAGESV